MSAFYRRKNGVIVSIYCRVIGANSSKHFTHINLFNSSNNPLTEELAFLPTVMGLEFEPRLPNTQAIGHTATACHTRWDKVFDFSTSTRLQGRAGG